MPSPSPPRRWVPEVRRWFPDTPIILVGNQLDLRTDGVLAANGAKFVSYDDAKALGKEVGAELVLECSAKSQVGLKELYHHHAIDVALRGRMMKFGYRRVSLVNKTCQHCAQPSKSTCKCRQMIMEVRVERGHYLPH